MANSIRVGRLMTNCYLADDGQGGVVVIDPGDEPDKILSALRGAPLRAILVTHFHADHTGAVSALLPHAEQGWVVSAIDYEMLKPGRPDIPELAGIPIIEQTPTKLVKDGDVLEYGDLKLRVLATPGHTPGGVTYVDDKHNIAYTGDTLFAGGCGRCDMYGGDEQAMQASLRLLSKLPSEMQVLPGHGRTGVIEYERQSNRQMLNALAAD